MLLSTIIQCESRCEMMSNLIKYDKVCTGEKIRDYRLALKLTQDELSEKIDKSIRTMTDIERGIVGMSMETLFNLCNVLKVKPNDLLVPETPAPADELEWAMQALSNLSEHDRSGAIDILRAYLRTLS